MPVPPAGHKRTTAPWPTTWKQTFAPSTTFAEPIRSMRRAGTKTYSSPLNSSRTPPGRPCHGKSSTATLFATTLMGSPPHFPARAANGRGAASHPEIAGASHWGTQSDATVARAQCAAWRALAFRQRQAQL